MIDPNEGLFGVVMIGSRRLDVHSDSSDYDYVAADSHELRDLLVEYGFILKDKGHFILARKGNMEIGLHPEDIAEWIAFTYARAAHNLAQDERLRAKFLHLRALGKKVEAYALVGIPTNDVLADLARQRG